MASTQFYGQVFLSAFNKEIDLADDAIKVMLLDNTYLPQVNVHRYASDISGEITGDGYTAGGFSLTNVQVSYDASTQSFILDADDASWDNSTITAAYAVIYDSTPATPDAQPLIAVLDFGGDESTVTATLLIAWDAEGIAAVTVS